MGSGGVGSSGGSGNSSCLKIFYLTDPFRKYPNSPNVPPTSFYKFTGEDSLGENRGDCGGDIRGG